MTEDDIRDDLEPAGIRNGELTEIAYKVINLLNADNGQDEGHFTELPARDLEEMLKALGNLPA